jgi:hypothetical protein
VNARRFNGRGLSALIRHRASRLGAAGLVLAGSVLAVSLAAAHTASPARLPKLAAREHLQANSGRLQAAVDQTLARSWADSGDLGSSGADAGGWGSTSQAGSSGNQQGYSVAISGNIAVAAAPGTDGQTGTAYLWDHQGGQWNQKWTLPDPRGAKDDLYSWSVAISSTTAGTYVAIGGNDNNGKPDIVYVYKASGDTWDLEAKIPDPGNNYLDMFGDALAMSSTTLVVGASCENDFRGAAYIYQRSGTSWNLAASMSDPLGKPYDSYGQAVAVSASTVLVSGSNTTPSGGRDVVYVYTQTSGKGWPETATISNPGATNNYFGYSVALSGTTAVIGAPEATDSQGTAYVYQLSGTAWTQKQELAKPGGLFAWSVAMSGNDLVVGEPVYGSTNCGTAYAYKLSGTQFAELGQFTDPSCTLGDNFGWSVALTSSFAVIGAPGANNGQGTNYEQPLP